jgi:hypothetical protein
MVAETIALSFHEDLGKGLECATNWQETKDPYSAAARWNYRMGGTDLVRNGGAKTHDRHARGRTFPLIG